MIYGSPVESAASTSTSKTQYAAAREIVQNFSDIYQLKLCNIAGIEDDDFMGLMQLITASISVKQKRPWCTNGKKGDKYLGNLIYIISCYKHIFLNII